MLILTPKHISSLSRDELERVLARSSIDLEAVRDRVEEIVRRVRELGDEEIVRFYEGFYGKKVIDVDTIRVSDEEFSNAYSVVDEELVEALKTALRNIEEFHRGQLPKPVWLARISRGVYVGQVWRPIESVGIYVPGGRASYPSTALMTAVPAKVAGVKRVIACTPPRPDGTVSPATLVALDLAGVRDVFKVGGAHAIAAMAYGTSTVPKVDKVVGPGNIWVATAKQVLRGVIDIDFIAGPTEILIVADGSADPYLVALDMVSQAEHDPLAAAVLVTTSKQLADSVSKFVDEIASRSRRREIIEESLKRNGAIIVVDSLEEAFKLANEYAPEHLEVVVSGYSMGEVLDMVGNAGSIFIGQYTPVALGDYVIGTNHVLPTNMVAKVRGGLSVLDFIKFIDFQYVSPEGIKELGPHAIRIAEAEGLVEHSSSVRARLKRRPNPS